MTNLRNFIILRYLYRFTTFDLSLQGASWLVKLYNTVYMCTSMLQRNDYVLIVSTDFTRAFDTVRHCTLMQKMTILDLPDNIYNWIANYFE